MDDPARGAMDTNGIMRSNGKVSTEHLLAHKKVGKGWRGYQTKQRPRSSGPAKSLRMHPEKENNLPDVRRLHNKRFERIVRVTRCADATILLTYESPEQGRRVEAIFR